MLELEHVMALAMPENVTSQRVMEKIGTRRAGAVIGCTPRRTSFRAPILVGEASEDLLPTALAIVGLLDEPPHPPNFRLRASLRNLHYIANGFSWRPLYIRMFF